MLRSQLWVSVVFAALAYVRCYPPSDRICDLLGAVVARNGTPNGRGRSGMSLLLLHSRRHQVQNHGHRMLSIDVSLSVSLSTTPSPLQSGQVFVFMVRTKPKSSNNWLKLHTSS